MRLDEDFDDNIKDFSKLVIIICSIAIVIWFITGIIRFIMPDTESTDMSMVKEDASIEETLSQLNEENNTDKEDYSFEEEEKEISSPSSNKNLVLYVNELPDDIYFAKIYTQEKQMAEKQALINKKVGENYIDSVLSYGALARWNPDSFPLKVYIQKGSNIPEFHYQEIKNAFMKWQETTQNFITFTYVDKPDYADIVCIYPENFVRSCDSNATTKTSKQYFSYDKNGNILRSNIELTTKDCNNQPYAQDMVYAIALREVGHSLGLKGHSGNSKDNVLYYPEANREHSVRPVINKSDLNTLRLIYSIEPDKINKTLTGEQKAKLISPDEVWGEKFERHASSEKAMLYNLETSPEVPDLYVSLANYYKEREEYDKAISVYSRSIVMMNDAEFQSKVYARVGDTYNLQDRYPEAIEAYKLSLKNLTNKRNLFDVYFNMAVIYYKQNKYKDSMMFFKEALKYVYDKENSYRLLVNMTEVYLKMGNYISALKCAEKAYSIKKSSLSTYLVAYTKYKNAEFQDTQKLLEDATASEAPALLYALLAQVYYETQQYQALEELAEKMKSEFPDKIIFTFK